MLLNNLKKVYFLGIGGIGMSALARYFKHYGAEVSGYDKTPSELTNQLKKEGIGVHFEDDISQIPADLNLVVYTPAIPEDLNEMVFIKKSGIAIKKRSEVLGLLTKISKTIAVAGTHGKTTVSTYTAHILQHSQVGCNAILGGISKNTGTNLILTGDSEWLVVEADEFDRSFLQIEPYIATVTSMDADHLDIYSNYNNLKAGFMGFVSKTHPTGKILLKHGIDLYPSFKGNIYSYSLDKKADFSSENLRLFDNNYMFDLSTPFGRIRDCSPGIPGILNVENAIAAAANALLAGVTEDEIRDALPTFKGIHRRFDYQINAKNLVFIDDYAHHPEEIRALVNSVRNLHPGRKILGIFQPHLYSRTRDFATGFAETLALLDDLILLPVYPAREKPVEGIDSSMILDLVRMDFKKLVRKENLIKELDQHNFDVLLTIGAGDIDLMVAPIKNHLLTKNLIK